MYYVVKVCWIDSIPTKNGGHKDKKVKESYLVNAVSVTDAEAKVIDEFKGTVFDFEVTSVTESKIAKVIN